MDILPSFTFSNEKINPMHELGKGSYGIAFLYKSVYDDTYYVCKFLFPLKSHIQANIYEINFLRYIKKLLSGCINNVICHITYYELPPSDTIYKSVFDVLQKSYNKKILDNDVPIFIHISDYIKGPSMDKYFFTSEMDCSDFLLQMFDTLTLLHSKNVIHSDIKNNNIVYDVINKYFVIIDLGLSYVCLDIDKFSKKKLRGTPIYTPNKLINKYNEDGFLSIDERKFHDIYAIMYTLYYSLNKIRPFDIIMIDNRHVNDETKYTPSNSRLHNVDLYINYFFNYYLNNPIEYSSKFFKADTCINIFKNYILNNYSPSHNIIK